MENMSFLVMVSELRAIVFQDLNLVTSKALIGTGMKKSSILIPTNGCADFAPLLPVSQFSFCSTTKDTNNDGAKSEFRTRQGSKFFNMIKNVDDNPAVGFLLGKTWPTPLPCPKLSSGGLKF